MMKLGGHDMKQLFLASTIIATWASLGAHAAAHGLPPGGVAPRSSCTALTGLTLPNTQILSATQKSGYCNVIGIINKRVSTQDPDHYDGRRRHRWQPPGRPARRGRRRARPGLGRGGR